jgi:preprotein translocase subunit SecG
VSPLIILVGIVHIFISTALVVFILLHSGKGTGVSSMLGGVMSNAGASASLIERNLDRITLGLALAFLCTSLILAYGFNPPGSTTSTGSVPSQQAPASKSTTP